MSSGAGQEIRGFWPGLRSVPNLGTRWSFAVGVLCLLIALAASGLIIHQHGLSGDEAYYERIATHPRGAHNFPYAFRVGLPWLVHLLPFSHRFSWELLALLSCGVAGGAMFALLDELNTERRLSAALATGFSISPPMLVVLLRNGRAVDAAAIAVITLGSLFIVRRRRLALMLTLLVGTTIHESCLFLIPFAYAVWAQRPLDREALRDLAAVAALPAAVYLYLRGAIVAVGERYQPGYGKGSFLAERVRVIRTALSGSGWQRELRRVALAFGPLWLLAPAALRDMRFARRGLVLIALCVAGMTFALDWGRAIFFSAPVVYAAAAFALRGRRGLAIATVAALLALDLGYGTYMALHGVRHGLDSNALPARGPVS